MDNLSDVSMLVHTTPPNSTRNIEQHDIKFKNGKYKGHTYSDVRQNHPQYFLWLVAQPAGSVWRHFGFICYCMDAMCN